jgi:hypothetical protein
MINWEEKEMTAFEIDWIPTSKGVSVLECEIDWTPANRDWTWTGK